MAEETACRLPSLHAGVTFYLPDLDPSHACLLLPIVENYSTANKIGPLRTPLPQFLYDYLLDHPVMAAALVNRLDLGLHKAARVDGDRYWASDGEGTEGTLQLLHRDPVTRVYYVEGRHDGTFLPAVTGKALVLLRMKPVKSTDGREEMETLMIAYTKLDNRLLSGLLSLVRPLAGKVITRQILKGFAAAQRLGEAIRQDPQRVWFEATDPPPLEEQDVAFLKSALANLHNPAQVSEPMAAPR
ncbi:MAG: hypothetical protein KF814_17920 [Nitrospiraceae bacterium]|nr:hypothetical protein [Nitrospiraceae bacterium]